MPPKFIAKDVSQTLNAITVSDAYVQELVLDVSNVPVKSVRVVETGTANALKYKIDGSIDAAATPAAIPTNLIPLVTETVVAASGASNVFTTVQPLKLLVISLKNSVPASVATASIEILGE